MASHALDTLLENLGEVGDLLDADPTAPGEVPAAPQITRVVGRASVVLLCSHFERYFYALNEEAVASLNMNEFISAALPEQLRLLHSQPAVEAVAGTTWDTAPRAGQLGEFVRLDAWLWGQADAGELQHDRLLTWMTSPGPENLTRYFRYWSIQDIFTRVASNATQRTELWLRITDLVDKRNGIAHGDVAAEATRSDVSNYLIAVTDFCTEADLVLSDQLVDLFHIPAPW
jgi:hypothetical protein